MARKHSEETVTRIIRQRQKNGDIYVIERQTRYDPEKKYNVVLSSKIIGKIPLGQNQVVPTRPKRPSGEKVSNLPTPLLTASRIKIPAHTSFFLSFLFKFSFFIDNLHTFIF